MTTTAHAASPSPPGPISKLLEEELLKKMSNEGLVIWLDKSADFVAYVDELQARWESGQFPFPVCAYRGSYLELILAIDDRLDGISPRPFLIYMPGFHYDDMEPTPIYEYYKAGRVYRKKLETLIRRGATGKLPLEQIDAYIAAEEELTLARADRWLQDSLGASTSFLDQLSLAMIWERLRDPKADPGALGDVEAHLRARLGISADWASETAPQFRASASGNRGIADWMTTWALAVEYVHDLLRPPFEELLKPLQNIPASLVTECEALAIYLRDHHSSYYARIADEFMGLIPLEIEQGEPEELGHIDTFRFEDRRSFEAALASLGESQWVKAREIAQQRLSTNSFWIQNDPRRGDGWRLVLAAAQLGVAMDSQPAPFAGATSLEEAAQRYSDSIWEVDQAHRILEQLRTALLVPTLPYFSTLLEHLEDLRAQFQRWSDQSARQFNALCEEYGFIGPDSLQQRRLFDQVVLPFINDRGTGPDKKVALFLVDALRFEMAKSLATFFEEQVATRVQLVPRLAELPTITAVGMNALAPVHQSGRLEPVLKDGKFRGFQTPQFQVYDSETRQRMMQHHVGGRTCPWLDLDEVIHGEKDLRRVIQQASLLVVHTLRIDTSGEGGLGPLAFESVLRDIRSAIRLLYKAGVQRFIVTSDHGFLMPDPRSPRIQHGKKTDPNGRWRLYDLPERTEELTSVPLTTLGYGADKGYLIMPRDARTFERPGDHPSFVHGGNAPAERIIPVLTIEHGRKSGGSTTTYLIRASKIDSDDGLHGLDLSVIPTQSALDFGGRSTVELAIRVIDAPGVTLKLHSVTAPAQLGAASIFIPPGESAELRFDLLGERDERVQLELYSPTLTDQVQAYSPKIRFAVRGIVKELKKDSAPRQSLPSAAEASPDLGLESLPEGPRRIFEYLQKYGAIGEADMMNILGSGRALRKFARDFEDHAALLSFEVAVEQTPRGKRYVKVQ